MVASVELSLGKGPESITSRSSVSSRVVGVLNEIGIDTSLKPHIERLTRQFMDGIPRKGRIAYDSDGNPCTVFSPALPPMDEEEARQSAKQLAPGQLRRSIQRELVARGMDNKEAGTVAMVAIGLSIRREVAPNFGLSSQAIYNHIRRFLSE